MKKKKVMKKKKISSCSSGCFLAIIVIFIFIAIGLFFNQYEDYNGSENKKPSSYQKKDQSSQTKQWFQGGNLHKATVLQWKKATRRNKLATSADWLAVTKWKGHLNTPDDFDRLKEKANLLVDAIDGSINIEGSVELDSMKITEFPSFCIFFLAPDPR